MEAEIKNMDRESLIRTVESLNAECLEIEKTIESLKAECLEIEKIIQAAEWLTPEQKANFSARVENAKSKTERMRAIHNQIK